MEAEEDKKKQKEIKETNRKQYYKSKQKDKTRTNQEEKDGQ